MVKLVFLFVNLILFINFNKKYLWLIKEDFNVIYFKLMKEYVF